MCSFGDVCIRNHKPFLFCEEKMLVLVPRETALERLHFKIETAVEMVRAYDDDDD
jgi:hypothetical protein